MDKDHLEIIQYDDEEQQFEVIDDLIEFVPEDADFEQYEYIEIEETQDTKAIANEWRHEIKRITQIKSEGVDHNEGLKCEDKSLIIKLETDNLYRDILDKKFKCSNRKCKRNGVEFTTQAELDEHNLLHLKQINANECPICNKILANQTKLQNHMETRHIPKNFTCDNCGKVFRSKDNLRLHMSHHRKHFIVECRACKKTYKSMQSLRYHLRQHFEHHQCETCGTVFEHKKLLLGHIAAKHNHELMLQCRYCSRMFSRNDVRETHERDIHKNGQVGSHFKCNECECAFDLREELMNHKILNHYTGVLHCCNECGKNFKKKSLLDLHMSSHKEKSIQCGTCKMMFTFITGLAKHRKLGRCKGPTPQTPKDTMTKEEIARIAKHQLLEITVNPVKKSEVDLFSDLKEEVVSEEKKSVKIVRKKPGRKRKLPATEETVKVENDPGKIKTEVAKKPFITIKTVTDYELEYRRRLASEVITSSSGRIIKRKLPQIFPPLPFKPINITKKANIPFECDKCGMLLDTKIRLLSHLNSHVRGMKHKCGKCDRTFCNIVSLKKHCAMAHREQNPFKEKRFQCDQCPKRYLTEFLLSQHRLSHENLKTQKCDQCSFATNALYDLKNHVKRIHQATKDYFCPVEICGKAFKRRCDMENHRKSVHSEIKVYVKCPTCDVIVLEKGLQSHMINRHSEKALQKPHICPLCGKAERYEKNLQRHYEAVHEPGDRGITYHCNECEQTFFRRRELTAHSFEHFKGTIHQCEECGNKYKSKKELTNHLYSHRCKEWPCPLCNVVFQTKSGRSKHFRKHNFEIEILPKDETPDEYVIVQEELSIG